MTSIRTRLSAALRGGVVGGMNTFYAAPYAAASLQPATPYEADHAALLDTLLGYYFSNALYDTLNLVITGAENVGAFQRIKAIRNPVAAFVEFYNFKLLPTPLVPMIEEAGNPAVVERIHEIWRRSAFVRAAGRAKFHFSLFGELFIRAAQREDGQPILQFIDPRHVVELDLDGRGYIEWIRIEIPYSERDPQTGKRSEKLRIEVWQKGRRRVWELDKRLLQTDALPTSTPVIDDSFADSTLAVDFVPIAYAPFIQVDNGRGISPILAALEDIDEANRIATRLHAMLFRGGRNTWAIQANMVAPDGRPIPAPLVTPDSGEPLELADGDALVRLPGNASLASLVPTLPYGDALAILQSHMDWIAEHKLFELGYFKTTTGTEESGKARRYRLAPALNRAEVARAAVLDALTRAHMMCFSVAQAMGIQGYSASEIGTFDAGDFEHTFHNQDLLIVSTEEKAATTESLVRAGATIEGATRTAGFSAAEVDDLARGDMVDGVEQ